MSIIVSELFLSACLTPLQHTLSGDTTKSTATAPTTPPLTLTFVHLPAPLTPFCFPCLLFSPSLSMSVKIDQFTGEQVGRLRQAPHLYPETHKFARGADCQRSCFTDWSGGEGRGAGGMTKTTACVGEHCLRLRLEIFSGKTGFYTQWSWVWRKGAHIKRSAFKCA